MVLQEKLEQQADCADDATWREQQLLSQLDQERRCQCISQETSVYLRNGRNIVRIVIPIVATLCCLNLAHGKTTYYVSNSSRSHLNEDGSLKNEQKNTSGEFHRHFSTLVNSQTHWQISRESIFVCFFQSFSRAEWMKKEKKERNHFFFFFHHRFSVAQFFNFSFTCMWWRDTACRLALPLKNNDCLLRANTFFSPLLFSCRVHTTPLSMNT